MAATNASRLKAWPIGYCKYCGSVFSKRKPNNRKRFCNHSCAAKYNNRGIRRHGNTPSNCLNCGIRLNRGKGQYCSRICQNIFQTDQKIKSWIDGKWSGANENGKLSSVVRRYLLECADYKCIWCNWREINSLLEKPILTIDHIDGNWTNNRPDNLRVLCYNCHTLTPTFGSLNMGNGVDGVVQHSRYIAK